LVDDGEEEKMTAFESLVGTPLKGDEILEAIPVCAPWAAMGDTSIKLSCSLGPEEREGGEGDSWRWVADAG